MIEAYLEKMSNIDYSGQWLSSFLQSWPHCLCVILLFNLFLYLFFAFFFIYIWVAWAIKSLTGLSLFNGGRKSHSAMTVYPAFDMTMHLKQFSFLWGSEFKALSSSFFGDVFLRLLRRQNRTFFFHLCFELPNRIWIKPFAEKDVEI